MPFMMDRDMLVDNNTGMDDLFFDTQPQIQQDQPTASPWQARYDELVAGGCSQKIAWSRVGSLARINAALNTVVIQVYIESPTGNRGLSEPTLLDVSFHNQDEIVHVEYSQNGLELAVVDICGRISIHNAAAGINRMAMTAKRIPEFPVQQEGVLALQWTGGSCPMVGPVANLKGMDWTYTFAGQRASYGPLNPHPSNASNAMFFLTRKGVLHMMYTVPYPSDTWYEQVAVNLEVATMLDQITHASFSLEHATTGLLLTTLDRFLISRVYRITVSWNYPNLQKREPLPRGFRPQPVIDIERVCAFRLDYQTINDLPEYTTELHIIPAMKDPVAGKEAPVQILFTTSQRSIRDGEYSSRVQRYELQPELESLHPGFSQLSSGGPSTIGKEAKSSMVSIKRADVLSSCGIISCSWLRYDTVLAITERNGSITFYDSFSIAVIDETQNSLSLRSFAEVGLVFPSHKNVCEIAISPNAALVVANLDNDERDVYILQPRTTPNDARPEIKDVERISVVSTLILGSPHGQIHELFDVLPMINSLNNTGLCQRVLLNLWSKQTTTVFDSSSNEVLLFNLSPLAQRMFIMQMCLTKSPSQAVAHRLAWLLLNMRHILSCFVTVVRSPSINERDRTNLPTTLLGLAKWHLDLIGEILNELVLATKQVNGQRPIDEVAQDMMNEPTSPVLALFLTTTGRIFLAWLTQYLRTFRSMANANAYSTQPNALAWRTFSGVVTACGLSLDRFEACCAGMNVYVKDAWAQHTDAQRAQAEMQILATGVVPQVLHNVVLKLLGSSLDRMLEDDNGYVRQGLKPMQQSGLLRGQDKYRQSWDVIRKVPLHGVKSLRVCTRCSSIMQNFQGEGRKMQEPLPQWVVSISKYCICGSQWMIWEP